jgi:hypothetical protein
LRLPMAGDTRCRHSAHVNCNDRSEMDTVEKVVDGRPH